MLHKRTDKDTSTNVKLIRKYLKVKILEDNITFRGYNEERQHVYDLIKKTIMNGESHSALILGPRGCGKTTLINSVLYQLSKEIDVLSDAIIIKLNGLVHHDDKIALKCITAQMQLENVVGDRVFGTFAENLSFLLSCIKSGSDRRCKSMVFILEEFDMFCHSGKTQALLYNLFDITHMKEAPMCVLGVTSRLDVTDLLEKRVKSRFSHRNIFIFAKENAEDVNQESTLDRCKRRVVELLSMPVNLSNNNMMNTPKKKKGKNRTCSESDVANTDDSNDFAVPPEVFEKCKMNLQQFSILNRNTLQNWNAHIQSLIEHEKVTDALEKFSYYVINEQILRNVLFQLVSKLSSSKPYLEVSDFTAVIDKTVAPEHRVKLLQSLSILELSLVIAMKHGMDIFDGQPMNFEMVLHRYTKFANANSSAQTVPRPVILKAFEHLQSLEVIMPVRSSDPSTATGDTGASRVQKEYQLYILAVPEEDLQEAVKGFKALPTEICHWLNNSVV